MSGWAIRPMVTEDVGATLAMRAHTRENAMTLAELEADYGVTPETAAEALRTTQSGWLCEDRDEVVGFCIGNRTTGEVAVLAVLPAYEGQGIGRALLTKVHDCLTAAGNETLWLWANPDPSVRASGFYARMGYRVTAETSSGDVKLERRPVR